MKKPESNLFNMVLTLLLITLAAGVSLGFMNELTKGPKAATRLKQKLNAITSVLPAFDNNPAEEVYKMQVEGFKDSLEFYTAKKDGEVVGTAVNTFTKKGFSGLIKMMVGFDKEGKIFNIAVLQQKETPGLGTKIKSNKFKRQFIGKHPEEFKMTVKKDGGEVDGITGATISSRAYCDGIERAFNALNNE